MHDVVVFVLQCQQQLCAVRGVQIQVIHQSPLVGRHPFFFNDLFFRCKGKAVMFFVQFCWVFKIDLKYLSGFRVFFFVQDFLLCRLHALPFEIPFRQRLAHRPSLEVVCVEIRDVFFRLARVVAFNQWVVCLRVPLACHRDPTTHPPFNENMHFQVRQQLQLDSSLFQKRVPAQAW